MFVWAVALSLALKLLFARYLVFGEALGAGAVADVLLALAVTSFAASVGGRQGRRFVVIAAMVVSVTTVGTVLYANYFNQVPAVRMLGSVRHVIGLSQEIVNLLDVRHVLFVLDLPVFAWLAVSRTPPEEAASARRGRHAVIGAAASAAFLTLAVLAYTSGSGVDSMRTAYTHGITAFQLSTAVRHPSEKVAVADAPDAEHALQQRIDALTRHSAGPRKGGAPAAGSLAGYNLVVIQAEALQDGLIGARVGGQPVMPRLEKLVGESVYFPNMYSQTGRGNTADAEFIANTSLYPGIDAPASVVYARKEVPSLPRAFSEAGYQTATFHTNDVQFWNRFQMYPALGFDRIYEQKWFGTEDFTRYGASDHVLFDKVADELLARAVKGDRFYAHVVTLSAHYPYNAVADRGGLVLPPEIAETQTGRYLQSQSYFDRELGRFLDELAGNGLLKNTVVVVYGDHFGMRFGSETDAEKAFRAQLLGHSYNRADYQNVPLVIRLPDDIPPVARYEEVLGQVDIMPTMADLFGLDLSGTPVFGRSAFVDTPTVMTRGGDPSLYLDGDALFLKGVTVDQDRRYVATSQEKIEPGQRPPGLDSTVRLLELSHAYASGLPERSGATDEVGYIPSTSKGP